MVNVNISIEFLLLDVVDLMNPAVLTNHHTAQTRGIQFVTHVI